MNIFCIRRGRILDINSEVIKKVADLARLKVDEKDLEPLMRDLNTIFDWISLLEEVDTQNVSPLTSVADLELHKRDDLAVNKISREEILANSPKADGKFFIVPKVVE